MQSWGLTDKGCVRKMNQDAYEIRQLDRNTLLCVVCDGMGGAKSGNIASSLAVDVFSQEIQRTWTPNMEWDKADQIMKSAVKLANFTVYDQARQFEEFDGMGTTLVAAFIRGRQVSFVNVGDSRAYIINQKGIIQVTRDHSVVQLMVDRGELTSEMAKNYPGKNLITRAVGTESMVSCDVFRRELSKGDYLLLCSDGLSNMMDDQEILFEVVHGVNKERCCKRLLDIAMSRGCPDNVTCVLVSL
ncbi:MAG: Stp1/IreP family PP2C-type Ser/Thr phosphatase [Clostridiales bacterium]|nr:Stp1/IreP family PP2C-type Ser/Thr phosphatase [Clostridiales bacterium]MCI6434311.1 Stp1/IreP family PP2C-type Ser/Thr phosphatase [Clostridiales bacterium]